MGFFDGFDAKIAEVRDGRLRYRFDPLAISRNYAAAAVTGGPVDSGHYLAEERPEKVLAYLKPFLAAWARFTPALSRTRCPCAG